jgi:hypothetical protein
MIFYVVEKDGKYLSVSALGENWYESIKYTSLFESKEDVNFLVGVYPGSTVREFLLTEITLNPACVLRLVA